MRTLGLQLMIVAAAGVAVLNAQAPAPAGARLVARIGNVEIQRGNAWIPAAPRESMNAGERIRTAVGSSASFEMGLESVVTLNESTEVQLRLVNGSPLVQLESGSLKIFSPSAIQVGAKDTVLESADRPLNMEIGYQGDRVNLTVFTGSVRNGAVVVHGSQDSTTRTYSAGRTGSNGYGNGYAAGISANPTIYAYPYFLYGNPGVQDPNAGRIVPPVVNNPTNPGYRPTQVIPPMSEPIHVPVTTVTPIR